jgi:hypothetical protein
VNINGWLISLVRKIFLKSQKDEMYDMNSNIFSISEDVIVSERNFNRLNSWLRAHGFIVEEVPYAEIAKQEGLLRLLYYAPNKGLNLFVQSPCRRAKEYILGLKILNVGLF